MALNAQPRQRDQYSDSSQRRNCVASISAMVKIITFLIVTHNLLLLIDININNVIPPCLGFASLVTRYPLSQPPPPPPQRPCIHRMNPSATISHMIDPWTCLHRPFRTSSTGKERKAILLLAISPKSSSSENDVSNTVTTAISNMNNSTTTIDLLLQPTTTADFIDNLNMYNRQKQHTQSFQSYVEENVLMGIPLTFELIAIITIYFVEGALGIARLAQSYLFKDTLHLGPAELSALSGLFVLPWTLKPLYGFLSDGIPLFGYKRKSYLILCGIIGTISYGILSYDPLWDQLPLSLSTQGTVVALMVGSACIAFSDVVADGIVVTRTREIVNLELQSQQIDNNNNDTLDASQAAKTAGGLQSLCWGASAVGGLISAYFSGSLLEVMSVRSIFGLTAVLPFLVALIATGMDEPRVNVPSKTKDNTSIDFIEGVRGQISTLWGAFQQSSIWKPTLFVFLWQSTPTSDGAFFYFLTNDLQFGPEFLGRVRFITAGAGLLGVFLYNQYFKTIQIKNILFWSTLLSFPLGLLPVLLITHVNRELGIPDTWLIYGDDVALAVLGTIAFMPTLVLAARLCPPGIEAVLFATLMSIYNGASTVGTELGALLTKVAGITESNFDNLALLTIFCNVSSLWPLVLIGWLDEVGTVSEAHIEASNK